MNIISHYLERLYLINRRIFPLGIYLCIWLLLTCIIWVYGLILWKVASKNYSCFYGWRIKEAMKSSEAWNRVNRLAGCLLFLTGIEMVFCDVLMGALVVIDGEALCGFGIMMVLDFLSIVTVIILVKVISSENEESFCQG